MAIEMAGEDPTQQAREAQCQVLVVDDDAVCLEEYKELIETLGYTCQVATDAAMALRAIAQDTRIGIVMTDLEMPTMDGLTFLDELSQRFMPHRPLVALVITGQASLERAISAMRSNAIDFLSKPIDLGSLSSSLRRATSHWTRIAADRRILSLRAQEDATNANASMDKESMVRSAPTVEDLQILAAQMMKNRESRFKFFDARTLAGPAWDILLDLAAAGLKGEAVPTSSACASAQVPLSTALRHVNQLVEAGLVIRRLDVSDKRRTLLELEPDALDLMTRYLASSWETIDRARG